MVIDSVANDPSFVEFQMQLQDKLLEDLFKMEAQIEVILMVDLHACATDQLYSYLCTLQDLVNHARDLSEQVLNSLIRAAVY